MSTYYRTIALAVLENIGGKDIKRVVAWIAPKLYELAFLPFEKTCTNRVPYQVNDLLRRVVLGHKDVINIFSCSQRPLCKVKQPWFCMIFETIWEALHPLITLCKTIQKKGLNHQTELQDEGKQIFTGQAMESDSMLSRLSLIHNSCPHHVAGCKVEKPRSGMLGVPRVGKKAQNPITRPIHPLILKNGLGHLGYGFCWVG